QAIITSSKSGVCNFTLCTKSCEILKYTGKCHTTTAPSTTLETTTTVTVTPSTTETTSCSCIVNGKILSPGEIVYNSTDKAGWCFSAFCSKNCKIVKHVEPCGSTTLSLPSTQASITTAAPPQGCPALHPPRSVNETWMLANCTIGICTGNNTVSVMPLKCPHITPVTCQSGMKPKKIYDQSGCCYHFECECVCAGWGGSHYLTFDGTGYTFQGNCTYILVKQLNEIIEGFKILADDDSCDDDKDLSCPKAIIIFYKSSIITLIRMVVNDTVKTKALVNGQEVIPPYYHNGIRISSSKITLKVEIIPINSTVTFNGKDFTIDLSYKIFGNNIEGQCGTCTNNRKDDCTLPDGTVVSSCSHSAPSWRTADKNKSHCEPVIFTTTVSPIHRSTFPHMETTTVMTTVPTTPCAASDICKIILGPAFSRCHDIVLPSPYYEACVRDACHNRNKTIICSSLEIYSKICQSQGDICINWREHTNGSCQYHCPATMEYKPCESKDQPTCSSRYTDKNAPNDQNGHNEGCFCPAGKFLYTPLDTCVDICECIGPDGKPRQIGEKWQSNCLDCFCNNATLSIPGAKISDPKSNCTKYECEKIGPHFIPNIYHKWCPPLDRDQCEPGTIRMGPDGCCQTCIQKACTISHTTTYINHKGCRSKQKVSIPYCEGRCGSSSTYSAEANMMLHKCTCCQELAADKQSTMLLCPDGKMIEFTYTYVKNCGSFVLGKVSGFLLKVFALNLQDEGRDPFQKMLVKKDCVRVPQAMSLSSLVTRTAGPGLNNALPKFTLTEDDDSVLVCVRDEAIRCPLQKGEPITIEAQEDRKLSLGDTALASGLTRHRSSTLVETVTKQTATGPGPKMVVGSPLPANLEVAGQPDVFQSNCPGVVTENSWDIIPEMEINEGSTKMWLESQISVDGLSTSLGSGSVGIDQGNLPGIEVRKTWQLEGGLHTGNGKQEDEKRVEVEAGTAESGQVEVGVAEPGQVEVGAAEPGQVEAGTAESGQVEVSVLGPGQVEVGSEQVEVGVSGSGQVEMGVAEPGQVEVGAAEPGQVEMGVAEPGQVEVGAAESGQVEVGAAEPGQVEVGVAESGQVEVGVPGPGQLEVGVAEPEQVEVDVLGAGQVKAGAAPLLAPQPCALMCLVHTGSLQTPKDTWRLLAEAMGRDRVTYQDVGTAVTPVGTHCTSTCMTPVYLAETEVNTTGSEGVGSEMTDRAVLTDSLLWNFSREALEPVPREDLERRLETALLINEVLSSQLNDLSKSKGVGLRAGPADQRETFTQTDSSQTPEVEDRYCSLYLQHASRVRELELSLEQYRQLHSKIYTVQGQQNLLVEDVEECLASADEAYEEMKNQQARMLEQLKDARDLARQSTNQLQTITQATARALEEQTGMRNRADEAEWKTANVSACWF
ncbi:hypothetical protein scyTo_0001018, partial [Scyliorhinus torazame]|nr:hypothetical protein [Scyliorhinus torazame]